jgi:hypothetical protein
MEEEACSGATATIVVSVMDASCGLAEAEESQYGHDHDDQSDQVDQLVHSGSPGLPIRDHAVSAGQRAFA